MPAWQDDFNSQMQRLRGAGAGPLVPPPTTPAPAATEAPSWWDKWGPTTTRVLGPTGMAVAGGLAGSLLGPGGTIAGAAAGGALGGGGGELIAQNMEIDRGTRKDVNPWMVAAETGIGAIPMMKGITPAKLALTGALSGGVSEAARSTTEDPEGFNLPSTLGTAAFGGALGRAVDPAANLVKGLFRKGSRAAADAAGEATEAAPGPQQFGASGTSFDSQNPMLKGSWGSAVDMPAPPTRPSIDLPEPAGPKAPPQMPWDVEVAEKAAAANRASQATNPYQGPSVEDALQARRGGFEATPPTAGATPPPTTVAPPPVAPPPTPTGANPNLNLRKMIGDAEQVGGAKTTLDAISAAPTSTKPAFAEADGGALADILGDVTSKHGTGAEDLPGLQALYHVGARLKDQGAMTGRQLSKDSGLGRSLGKSKVCCWR